MNGRPKIAACVAGLVLVGCAAEERPGGTPGAGAPEGAGADPAERIVRVSGSDDAFPLARSLARRFEELNPGYEVVFSSPTHTLGGVAAVSLGEADIGLVSRPLTGSERASGATYLHLAHDIIVFVVDPETGVDSLTREQVRGIYSGAITDWSEVGGRPGVVAVLDRAEHTSLKLMLRRQIFGDSLQITPAATVLEGPDDMVTSLSMSRNAIGYLSLGNAFLADVGVVHLAVDGVRPVLASFERGEYPYYRPFGFVVGPVPTRAAMKFVRFVYGEEGQRTITGLGFVPVTMELVIAVLPEQDLLAQEHRYAPLVEYLGERLGLQTSVKLRLLPDYGTVIDEFRAGRVNAAFLGSLAFALAHAQAGVEPIARPEKDGVSQYHGIIVAREDSGIEDWSDLRGRSFGLVDRATTAGHLFPLIYLRERGVTDLAAFFGSVTYTGSHDLLFLKVYNGELDAGAAKDLMLDHVAEARPEVRDGLRRIAASPPVPNNAFVLGGDLDFPCFGCHALVPQRQPAGIGDPPRQLGELAGTLANVLLGLHETERGREVLEALGADRFVRTTVDDLDEVNRMIRRAGFDPATYRP